MKTLEEMMQEITMASPASKGEVALVPSQPRNPNISYGLGTPHWDKPVLANRGGTSRGNGSSPNTSNKPHSEQDKAALAAVLMKVCALQKQYGKTEAELETLVEGISWVLAGYSMQSILQAIRTYVSSNADIPTPADLKEIIDPTPKPLDKAMYISLQKLAYSGVYLTRDERAYCEAYRQQELSKVRGGSDELREVEREIEQFRLTYDSSTTETA